jgi:hypothetical protein
MPNSPSSRPGTGASPKRTRNGVPKSMVDIKRSPLGKDIT